MGRFTKIDPAGLGKLNNAEYRNFMIRYYALAFPSSVPEEEGSGSPSELSLSEGNPTLGITGEEQEAFKADLDLLTDLVSQSRISDETASMQDLDKRRGDLVVYLTATISQARKNPIESQSMPARSLYNVIKPYIGIARLANQQETALIDGLLTDLAKETNATNITALGLTAVVDALREANAEYARLTSQRTSAKAAAIKDDSASVRARLDEQYDDMTTMAFVQSVANPSDEASLFISELNALIAETTALYNQRMGMARANKEKEEAVDKIE